MRDCDHSYLSFDPKADGALNDLIGHSITYRVAIGPRAGQKVFTLHTLPPQLDDAPRTAVAQASGFSLHAGIGIETDRPEKLDAGMDARGRATLLYVMSRVDQLSLGAVTNVANALFDPNVRPRHAVALRVRSCALPFGS